MLEIAALKAYTYIYIYNLFKKDPTFSIECAYGIGPQRFAYKIVITVPINATLCGYVFYVHLVLPMQAFLNPGLTGQILTL